MEELDIPKLVDGVLRSVLDMEIIPFDLSVQNCEKWDSLAQLSLLTWLESDFDLELNRDDIILTTSRNGLIHFLERRFKSA
jgi:acyl carrier protein